MPSEPSLFGRSTDNGLVVRIRRAACPVCFTMVVVVATFLCGYFTYTVTHDLQQTQFEDDYNSVADSAVVQLRKGLDDNIRGARVGSAVYSSTFPFADAWPFVYLYHYDDVISILNVGVAVTFAPLVKPEEATEFETFAYRSFNRTYQTRVAQSSFGEGIFAPVNASCFNCLRYHDVSGNTTYGSPNRILTPILQSNTTASLMFNFHSDPLRGATIDAMINCTNQAISVDEMSACAAIGPPTYTLLDNVPVSFVFFPVFPMRNSTTLVGLTFVSMRWNLLLQSIFPPYVSQVHCVLQTDNAVLMFVIEEGVVVEVLERDAHQEEMNKYARVVSVVSRSNLQSASSTYTLTIYPTRQWRGVFVNRDPAYATLIVVVVVLTLFLAIGCGLYFTRLRRRATKIAAVSKIKRLFIRYISHEIRTPLNTVSLGLNLLLNEITIDVMAAAESAEGKRDGWCKLVAELMENSQCAVMLLDDLLTFEQFEQGSLGSLEPTERQVLPVWEMLQGAIASFSVRAKLSDVQLVTTLEIDAHCEEDGDGVVESDDRKTALAALRVLGNEVQLKRVVNSLLSNALQFSQEGGQITIICRWVEHTDDHNDRADEATPQKGTATIASSPRAAHHRTLSRISSHSSYRSSPLSHTFASTWDGTCAGMNRVGVVRVAVTDQGAGMTAEQTAQVFGKGKRFSLSALQAGQGSGIGLFVCKIIAEQHHASIRVTSPGLGLGSTYTLDLPVFVAPAQLTQGQQVQLEEESTKSTGLRSPRASTVTRSTPLHHASTLATSAEKKGEIELQKIPDIKISESLSTHTAVTPKHMRGVSFGAVTTIPAVSENPDPAQFTHKRILVVDDAPSNRKMLVRVLAKQGHMCEQAHDGQMAVDMVQAAEKNSSAYDMILMDYEMPVMNGPTATAKLRELGYTLPIVGVTGNVLCTDVEYFMAQGADAVLPKPLQLAALEAVWKKKIEEEQLLSQDGGIENA